MRGSMGRVSCLTMLAICLAVLAPHPVRAGSPAYQLAFVVYVGTGYKVQTVDMNAQVTTLFDLSQIGASKVVPVLSADGKHVAYLSQQGVTIRDTSGNEQSIPVQFDRPIDVDSEPHPIHLSPNGHYVAIRLNHIWPATMESYMEERNEFLTPTEIYRVDKPDQLLEILQMGFAWSADSSRCVYAQSLPYHLLQFVTVPISDPPILGNDHALVTIPITYFHAPLISWSPDSRRIAFVGTLPPPLYGTPKTHQQLYAMNVDVPDPFLMVDADATISQPIWSPSGSQIAFALDHPNGVYLIKMDGQYLGDPQSHDLQALSSLPSRDLAWSPDGTQIAFISKTDQGDDLDIVSVDGRHLNHLLSITNYVGGLEWMS